MKKEIFYLSMIIVIEILLSGCSKSKDEPQPEPEPPGKNWKFKVMEYQTNLPVSGAKLELSRCIPLEFGGGCSNIITVGTWISDKNGEMFIKPADIHGTANMNTFSKNDYWSKGHVDTVISTETQDSSVVRLFPYSWLKIHLKNEVLHADPVKYSCILKWFLTVYQPIIVHPNLLNGQPIILILH